eukprot:TRINITY_DN31803_c2_g1_i1.p1 TRINITY_DN31803_c2_g1~~TRINITY_DN31803_c2_g1_i1.p1  ORF type:complete len:217 (-),score=-27.98 TRINITY_DN31803_c2_g1_i1:260-910(-)
MTITIIIIHKTNQILKKRKKERKKENTSRLCVFITSKTLEIQIKLYLTSTLISIIQIHYQIFILKKNLTLKSQHVQHTVNHLQPYYYYHITPSKRTHTKGEQGHLWGKKISKYLPQLYPKNIGIELLNGQLSMQTHMGVLKQGPSLLVLHWHQCLNIAATNSCHVSCKRSDTDLYKISDKIIVLIASGYRYQNILLELRINKILMNINKKYDKPIL